MDFQNTLQPQYYWLRPAYTPTYGYSTWCTSWHSWGTSYASDIRFKPFDFITEEDEIDIPEDEFLRVLTAELQ